MSHNLFEVETRLQGKQLKEKLQSLMQEASTIDSSLVNRVDEIHRWVKDVKPGSLVAKKLVSAFLLQFIADATVWLKLQSLSTPATRELAMEEMSPPERYWYGDLFPKWLQETDSKFYIWKQKIMSGEFQQADEKIIQLMAKNIAERNGDFLQRYIADLSMATDLIVSRYAEDPLCLQITTLKEDFLQKKYQKWQHSLLLWEIDRGLLVSYNPSNEKYVNQLANLALYNSDNLKVGRYLQYCF